MKRRRLLATPVTARPSSGVAAPVRSAHPVETSEGGTTDVDARRRAELVAQGQALTQVARRLRMAA